MVASDADAIAPQHQIKSTNPGEKYRTQLIFMGGS
jgi:hypothetical protein